jgi:type I restriction enzyme M protein
MEEIKKGYIVDYATDKLVDGRKPEEEVRQNTEIDLCENYFYDKKLLDIEVSIQRGEKNNKKNKNEQADIVIYKTKDKNKRNQFQDILAIIETKRPHKKEGVSQLKSYMTATSSVWGVWTNGEDIEYLYKDINGEIKENQFFSIPRFGEDIEDIGKVSKKKLVPIKNLKPKFRRILEKLYANTTISRREKLGSEMIKLIFCKIWDEKYEVENIPKFRVGKLEDNTREREIKETGKRIKELFEEVKNDLGEEGIFGKHEKIEIDDKSLAYVVGELQNFSLTRTEKDVVGDAFEVFAESKFAGEKGEFFTPRQIVKMVIKFLDIQPEELIIDPACGSGGFLIYALEDIWSKMDKNKKYRNSPNLDELKRNLARRTIYGIDKELDLVKICKAYMTIIGDGRSKIMQENTLHSFDEYQSKPRELLFDDGKLKKFNFVITNPPFGSKTKVQKEDAKIFDLGHKWKYENSIWKMSDKPKETETQVLFIERCLEFLKDGGKLAIVLPETYFFSPSTKYVLNYIKRHNIIAIFDLPHNSFRPHCNAKTCLLILQKNRPQNKKIFMAVAEEMGNDHLGREIHKYDLEKNKLLPEIWDDTKEIIKEIDGTKEKKEYTFFIDAEKIIDDIYVPRYYWDKKVKDLKKIAEKKNLDLIKFKDLIDKKIIKCYRGHGSPNSEFKGKGDIPYIRVKDIVNWDIYKNPTSAIPENEYLRKKGKGIDLEEGDIVMIRRGSYRIGSVAMLSNYDKEILLTKEIEVIRILDKNNEYGIDENYLIYLLSNELTHMQLYNKVLIDTTLPNIGDRYKELLLPIERDKEKIKKIKESVKKVFQKKWDAIKDIEVIKDNFDNIIT